MSVRTRHPWQVKRKYDYNKLKCIDIFVTAITEEVHKKKNNKRRDAQSRTEQNRDENNTYGFDITIETKQNFHG